MVAPNVAPILSQLREIVAEVIAHAGYTVMVADNGEAALAQMRASAPCIVMLDLMMPVMNGWEVVDAMQADAALRDIPVCVVSAQTKSSPPRCVCLLQKPTTRASILAAIEMHARS